MLPRGPARQTSRSDVHARSRLSLARTMDRHVFAEKVKLSADSVRHSANELATTSRDEEASIAGICLMQAVRSFLHFSQLSAWLSKSAGSRPTQLLYRVTVPGQPFASKFAAKPVEHHFPVARVGRLATHVIKVRPLLVGRLHFFTSLVALSISRSR